MKRFQFRLDAVLRVRRIREDAARAELLRANGVLGAAAATVVEREATYRDAERPHGPMTSAAHSRVAWALDQSAAAIQYAQERRQAAAADAATARDVWAVQHQGVRAIERLRERALQAHRAEVRRDEDRLADELAVLRHSRSAPAPVGATATARAEGSFA